MVLKNFEEHVGTNIDNAIEFFNEKKSWENLQ